eukprot:TRINITY_DN42_c0_g1_i27.p1 TRINITY_DN42_c0_g1~~TRINITY_DN42_c0_g1_i27.p1  ORF type:complete len:135 (-),score=4.25 TRINITY_DN42_c0_g1_i27:378-782(-)
MHVISLWSLCCLRLTSLLATWNSCQCRNEIMSLCIPKAMFHFVPILAGSVQFGSICFASSVSAFAQSKKNPEDAVQFTIWVSSLFFFSFLFFGRYELREGVEMRKVRNTSWPLHDSYEFHRLLNAFGIVAAALE